MEKSESYQRGEELLRKMAGDEYMKGREERVRLFPDMAELTMGTLYGEIWDRPNLDKRSRSMIMVALAVGIMEIRQNLELHIRGALANGVTKDEILEIIMHTGFYTGFPPAVTAVGIALDIFKKAGLV